MLKRNISPYLILFSLISSSVQADLIGLNFSNISFNGNTDIAGQLSAQVLDQNQALTDFSENISNNEVLFTFSNNVGTESNLSEIYFDDGTIFSQTRIINSLGGFTNFTDGGHNGINPGNLPAHNNIDPIFEATADFGADTQGNKKNGVNESGDIVGIVIQLQNGLNFNDLHQSLYDGTLRLGLHVRSIGSSGFSDSFVNIAAMVPDTISAVPLPAAGWLFAPALLLLSRVSRKKHSA